MLISAKDHISCDHKVKGVDSTFSWENKRCQEGGHIWESWAEWSYCDEGKEQGRGEKDESTTGRVTSKNYQDIEVTFK